MDAQSVIPAIGPVLRGLGVAGLTLFAISGALTAVRQRLDIIAACFFALVAAVGGGTMRDILIGAPVFWVQDGTPLLLSAGAAMVVWIVPVAWWPARALDWFDAAGLSAFAVYGASKALSLGVSPLPSAAMGIVTACLGGVMRDVAAGVPSIMLRNELYVTAALVAATLFVGLTYAGARMPAAALIATGTGFALRGAAIRWGIALPRHRG